MLLFIPSFSLTNSLCFYHLKDSKTEFPKVRVWGTVSWILAGVLIGFLKIEDKATPLIVASMSSLLLSIYCLFLPHTPPIIHKSASILSLIKSKSIDLLLKDNPFKVLLLSVVLIYIPASYYYSFVNPFLNEMHVVNAAGKMAIGQVTEIGIMLSLPFLFRIWRLKVIIFIGLLCWGIRYLIFVAGIYFDSELLYLLALLLHGAAYVMSILVAQILIDIKFPNALRSSAQGFFSFLTMGLGTFIGTFAAGETVASFQSPGGVHDWTSIWVIPGVFGILVALFFYYNYRESDNYFSGLK
jgi:nucleoside transporter